MYNKKISDGQKKIWVRQSAKMSFSNVTGAFSDSDSFNSEKWLEGYLGLSTGKENAPALDRAKLKDIENWLLKVEGEEPGTWEDIAVSEPSWEEGVNPSVTSLGAYGAMPGPSWGTAGSMPGTAGTMPGPSLGTAGIMPGPSWETAGGMPGPSWRSDLPYLEQESPLDLRVERRRQEFMAANALMDLGGEVCLKKKFIC